MRTAVTPTIRHPIAQASESDDDSGDLGFGRRCFRCCLTLSQCPECWPGRQGHPESSAKHRVQGRRATRKQGFLGILGAAGRAGLLRPLLHGAVTLNCFATYVVVTGDVGHRDSPQRKPEGAPPLMTFSCRSRFCVRAAAFPGSSITISRYLLSCCLLSPLKGAPFRGSDLSR